jgi:hypothetical protein
MPFAMFMVSAGDGVACSFVEGVDESGDEVWTEAITQRLLQQKAKA